MSEALIINSTLTKLDISGFHNCTYDCKLWLNENDYNKEQDSMWIVPCPNVGGNGAVLICNALKTNTTLTSLNLSWNFNQKREREKEREKIVIQTNKNK